jgi:hypothetical protein
MESVTAIGFTDTEPCDPWTDFLKLAKKASLIILDRQSRVFPSAVERPRKGSGSEM